MIDNLITEQFEYTPEELNQESIPTIQSPVGPIDELDLPQSIPGPGTGGGMVTQSPPAPRNYQEALAFVERRAAQKNPLYGSGFTTPNRAPFSEARKFVGEDYGYIFGADNEDFYGQRQSGLAKLGKGIFINLPVLAVAKTGQGLGFVANLFNPENMFSDEGYFASAVDNGFSNAFATLEDKLKNEWSWTKTFQEAEDREKGFWSRMFTDANFWSDEVVDGTAFMLSAYLPGGALSKLGVGMGIAKGLSRFGIGSRTAAATLEGLETVPNYLRNASAIASKLDRGVQWGLATASESMYEAKGVKDNLIKSLENSGLSEEEKKEIIATNTKNTFLFNAALLGFTNFLELKYLYKAFGKTEGVAGDITQGRLGDVFQGPVVRPAVGTLDKILQSPAKTFIRGVVGGVAREGFLEENAQLAIQRFNEENGAAGKVTSFFDLEEVGNQFFEQTIKAVTGLDKEAALSIGLGGILGGIPGGIGEVRQASRDKVTTDNAIAALNLSQQNWLKYGNIYKTQVVERTNPDGSVVKEERILLDDNNKPVVDLPKMNAITANFQSNVDLLKQADQTTDRIKQTVLRDTAFANFVTAHINAGIEDDLIYKLDKELGTKPEDLVKLGFDPSQDYKKQIQEYKQFATDIIKQSKLINDSILFDDSVEDKTRKGVLIDMVANQAVYKKLSNQINNERTEVQNELAKNKNSSLTDGIVDQLNALQYRIDSMKQVLSVREKAKNKTPLRNQIYQEVLQELEQEKADLIKDNELTVRTLKQSGDYYNYGKSERMKDPLLKSFLDKVKVQGQIENEVRADDLVIGKIADAINGKSNYLAFVNESIVPIANQALNDAEKKRKKEEENIDDEIDVEEEELGDTYIVTFDTPSGDQEMELTEGEVYVRTVGKTKSEFKIVKFEEEGNKVRAVFNGAERVLVSEDVARILTLEEGWVKQEKKVKTKPKGSKSRPQDEKEFMDDDNEESEDIETDEEDDGLIDGLEEDDVNEKRIKDRGPKWEDVKFRKTFGKQYIDDPNDEVLNTKDGNDRFYRFTAKHNLANRFYSLMLVTKDNDPFADENGKNGIIPKDYPDAIAAVVVKSTKLDNGDILYEYVDEDNNVISDDNANKDNVVYSFLADVNNWTVERVRDSYTVDKLTLDEEIQADIDAHKEWQDELRQRIKEEDIVTLKVLRTSPGVTKIQFTTETDEKGKKIMAQNPVVGRLIEENPDWKDLRSISNPDSNITLRVATAKGNIPGIKKGHLVMQEYDYDDNGTRKWGDKITKVFNRKLSEREKDLVIKSFVRLSELYIKKHGNKPYRDNKKKAEYTDEEKAEKDLIENYLRGVLNFYTPKRRQDVTKHFWIQNGLHAGTTVIKFEKKEILANKDKLLKNVYHNVNNAKLSAGDSFTEVSFVNGKAVPGEAFDTYEQYLLGERKEEDTPPVYTSMPLFDSLVPQRTSVYILWKDEETDSSEDEEAEEDEDSIQFRKLKLPSTDKDIDDFVAGKKKDISINGVRFGLRKNSDGTITVFVKKKNGSETSKTLPSLEDFQDMLPNFIKDVRQLTGYIYGTISQINEDVVRKLKEEKRKAFEDKKGKSQPKKRSFLDDPEEDEKEQTEEYIRGLFKELADGKKLSEFTAVERAYLENPIMKKTYGTPDSTKNTKSSTKPTKKIVDDVDDDVEDDVEDDILDDEEDIQDGPFTDIESSIDNAVLKGGYLVATLHAVNVKTNEVKVLHVAKVPAKDRSEKAKNFLRRELLRQIQENQEDDQPFRLAFKEESDITNFEDFEELNQFMQDNLPQWSVKKMSHLINGKAWGAFQNDALYIYEKAEYGTGFHEAFEGVWKHYLTDQEREELIAEFRSQDGRFTNPFSNEEKSYSEASVYDVREMLAEGLIDFIANGESTKVNTPKAKNFFEKLWDFIKNLFGLPVQKQEELDKKINKIYKKITTGGFADVKSIRENDLAEIEYRAVPGLTQKQTSELMEGLMYHFFLELYKQGANIDTLLNSMTKEESNLMLRSLFGNAYNMVAVDLEIADAKLSKIVSNQRDKVYERFKQLLGKYGAIFSEVEIEEDKVTDTLGIKDSISVNPKSLTSTNVMMLIASLPYRVYSKKSGKYPVAKNELNQFRLVNADRVHTLLLNELSNIVVKYDKDGNKVDAFKQMMEKLDSKYLKNNGVYKDGYAWIISLQQRLKYKDANGNIIPPSQLTKDDILIQVAFTKSFTNIKYQPEKLIISEDGNVFSIDPLINVNEKRIQKEWSNNVKVMIQNKDTKLFNVDKNGQMFINRFSSDFIELMQYQDDPSMFGDSKNVNMTAVLNVLGKMGIRFSADEEELEEYAVTMREIAVQIVNLIFENKIESVADLYENNIIQERIKTLAAIENRFNSEDNILTYLNGEGEMQYSVGISSLYGNMINIINSVENLTELIQTCPWLGYIDDKGKPVLYPYQQGSELLRPGGTLFDKNGKRKSVKSKLKYHVLAGTGISEVDGVNTSKLQFPERIAFKMHYLMDNVAFSIINSDKSQEFGIGIPEKNTVFLDVDNIKKFLSTSKKGVDSDNVIIQRYISQLKDEMLAAEAQQVDPVDIQYYKDKVYELGHFRDVLSPEMIRSFNEQVIQEEEMSVDEFIDDNIEELAKSIADHINRQVDATINLFKQEDVFYIPESGRGVLGQSETSKTLYVTNALDNDKLNNLLKLGESQYVRIQRQEGKRAEYINRSGYTDADIRAIAAYVSINEELLAAEQHKLIYGHPAMYNDLPKRANGATSTKEPMIEDENVLLWMDENMPRLDGSSRSTKTHQTFRNISFKDVDVVSLFHKDMAEGMYADLLNDGVSPTEAAARIGGVFNDKNELIGYRKDKSGKFTGAIAGYLKMTEADAMAWILPDMTRDLLFLSSQFDERRDQQWNYEVAYEKLVRSGTIENIYGSYYRKGDPLYKSYEASELKKAKEVFDKGDPGYQFEILKTQYFGFGKGTVVNKKYKKNDVTHPAFLKHSVQPKFFRHVEGTQFESLYVAAQNNNLDLIGFESGHKVGNVLNKKGDFTPVYNNDGIVNTIVKNNVYDLPQDMPVLELFSRFYGIQVQQNSKPKNFSPRGSQITKVVMTNFYENGEPVKGDKKVEKLIKDYNSTLEKMFALGKKSFIKELGLEETKKGYVAKDLSRLVQLLRDEAISRDLPENMVDAINAVELADGTQELQYQFDTLINRDKIDNILNSLVDSRIISEKIHGKSSVQVASTLYESNPRDFVYLKDGVYIPLTKGVLAKLTDEQRKSIRMASSDLKFYTNKSGAVTSMEVYVNWPFKEVTPEELGLELKNGIYKLPEGKELRQLDRRLLNIVGFRIPTQSPNSIESIVIKGFTPASNGDMIVVPSEIVGKSGSDFDIDKLNLYMPNYKIEHNQFGTPEFKKFITEYLTKAGQKKSAVKSWVDKMTVNDIETINSATFTDYGKQRHEAQYSLNDLQGKIVDSSIEQLKIIKKAIQAFNVQYRGKKSIVYREQDDVSKEGLQNKFIDLTRQLITHPLNYGQLVLPNTTKNLEVLADEVKSRKIAAGTKAKENEKSPTYLRSFVGSVITRERYLTAKRMVGISALHTTFHTMAQKAGIKINGDVDMKRLYYLVPKKQKKNNKKVETELETLTEPIKIKLDHKPANPDGTFNLGHKNDTTNVRISDSFSEATSGFVDGAKNPFVFDLNFSMQSTSTWFYLLHHGVPKEQVAYFMNQPIIDQYLALQAKNRSSFKKINNEQMTREEMMYEVISPWYKKVSGNDRGVDIKTIIENARGTKEEYNIKNRTTKNLNDIYNSYEKFDVEELQAAISKGSKADPSLQLAVLMAFLRYEAQASMLTDFIISIGYDTSKTKTVQENYLQMSKWKRMERAGFIENPQSMMSETFLGELKKIKEDVPNIFKNFFISLSPEVQKVFEPLYDKLDNPDYFISRDDATYLINRYQNHVLNYILHTTRFKDKDGKFKVLNEMYKEMFIGDNSMAKRLYELKRSDDPEISDNLFIKELLPLIGEGKALSNISLFRSRMDTFDINNIIESLNNLREYGKKIADRELIKFTDDITKFSILQSGLQTSGIDFKKVLSTELYSELIKTILDQFKVKPNLDVAQIWRTFHQNNWNSRMIVPKAPAWAKLDDDGALAISIFSSASEKDFYVKYVFDSRISPEKYKKMREKGTAKQAWIPKLYQRTEYTDAQGVKILYYPIDILGDGRNMTEIYQSVEQDSVLEKNRLTDMSKDTSILNANGNGWIDYSPNKAKTLGERFGDYTYLGGKKGFDPKGKSTPEGDGKDKAMRKKADSIIVEMIDDTSYFIGNVQYEIDKDMIGRSSSETSLYQISFKNDGFINKKGKTYTSLSDAPNVVMLARNSEYKGRPLLPETKRRILELSNEGATFIVGDMPNVDSQYVDYLQSIGATYDVYYTGDEPRFNPVKETEKKKPTGDTALKDLFENKKGKDSVKAKAKVALAYQDYKEAAEEAGKKPLSKTYFEKLTLTERRHLLNQLKDC